MKTSKAGIALIKTAEGFRETAYWDVDGYSIGYGHHGATAGQRVSREEAERLLAEDLERVEAAVSRVNPRLGQNQFDACVSLAYNIGTGRFGRSNTALLIAADPTPRPELEREWKEWRLAGGKVSQALVDRREKEWSLYCRTTAGSLILGIAAGVLAVGAASIIALS